MGVGSIGGGGRQDQDMGFVCFEISQSGAHCNTDGQDQQGLNDQCKSLCCIQFFVTSWTVACQAPLPRGFSRQEYWSGILQGIFLTQRSNPGLLHCRQILHLLSHQGSPSIWGECNKQNCVQGLMPTVYISSVIHSIVIVQLGQT